MRLRDLAFLADENIHSDLVAALRQRGRDILRVQEAGLAGSDDLIILRRAFAENRVVLSHDSDFGQLVVVGLEPIVGIVYLRPGHIDPTFTLETLEVLFEEVAEVDPPFIIVAERVERRVKIRIRKL